MISRGKIAAVPFHGEFCTAKKSLEREKVPLFLFNCLLLDNHILYSLKDCTKIEKDMV